MTKNKMNVVIITFLTLGLASTTGLVIKTHSELDEQREINEVIVNELSNTNKKFDELGEEFENLTKEHLKQSKLIEEKDTKMSEQENKINSLQEDLKKKDDKISDLTAKKKEKEEKEKLVVKEAEKSENTATTVSHKTKPVENSNKKSITMEATGFTAFDGSQIGITAMGIDVRTTSTYQGMKIVACDPNVIPLGTIVQVTYGDTTFTAIVGDTGGLIKQNKIDILFDTVEQALNFGRQTVTVTIL